MGLFSKLFGGGKSSGIVSGRNPGKGWIAANRFNQARGGFAGGYGAITFGNIMNAHCDESDIVEEFGLDDEGCDYSHPEFGCNCWTQAYREALQVAMIEAQMMAMFGIEEDPEDLIDYDEVQENATDYAMDLASMYISGKTWIPEDMLDWAYYDISDHNN